MPSRNRIKPYIANSFYHVYNRGTNGRRIFKDNDDFAVFLNLLKRHLDQQPHKDRKGRNYIWLHQDMELLAFCLMPNHFHLCIYQTAEDALPQLMRPVSAAYTLYFNKKYQRYGPLFQGTYKATCIQTNAYIQHITRYIHLNPKNYEDWDYSSLPYYMNKKSAAWVHPERILDLFQSSAEYRSFVKDYKEHKRLLDELRNDLADT